MIEGKEAVVLGRSNIVGIPVALLLMQRNATVTIVHSRTKNMEEVIRGADIVVAAVGKAELVKGSWLKPGAVVIDVGINSVDDATKKAGYRLVGDVDFADCKNVASKITPVPGGVGPMTIAMLLRNTVNGCRRTAMAAQQAAVTSKLSKLSTQVEHVFSNTSVAVGDNVLSVFGKGKVTSLTVDQVGVVLEDWTIKFEILLDKASIKVLA